MMRLDNRARLLALALAAGLWTAANAAAADQNKSAEDEFTNAYMEYVSGESAAGAGQADVAMDHYRTALGTYLDISTNRPGWRANIINYRITQCLNQIKRLQSGAALAAKSTAARQEPPDSGEAAEPGAGEPEREVDAAADVQTVRDERDALAAENRQLSQDLAAMRSQAAAAQEHRWWRFWEKTPRVTIMHPRAEAAIKQEARRLMDQGKPAAAVPLLRDATDLMPQSHELGLMLGTACCQAGRYADAVPILSAALRDDPNNAAAHVVLGTAYMGTGGLRRARKQMEEALQINPDLAEAHYNLAQIYLMMKPPDVAQARAHYDTALRLGGEPDAAMEEAIRKAYLTQKTADLRKKKLLPGSGGQSNPVSQGQPAGNTSVQKGQP